MIATDKGSEVCESECSLCKDRFDTSEDFNEHSLEHLNEEEEKNWT